MRKEIIIGTGILMILLALAGTGNAKVAYGSGCTYCHPGGVAPALTDAGLNYSYNHDFDGETYPSVATGCTECHVNLTTFLPLTANGSFYNETHRYNSTTLAANISSPPGCANCHDNVINNSFSLLTGTATYLTSSVCEDCHKKKYDDWYDTLHRVMLTNKTNAELMNLPLPDGQLNWSNITFVIVGKTSFRYLNETGNFFSKYDTVNMNFSEYTGNYSCGSCHTTGFNATGGNKSGLMGINGTWEEEGITCENCHGAGGNGHNVTVYKKGEDCQNCHDGATRQGPAYTNKHYTAPAEESTSSSCTHCHSPYDRYIGGKAASLEEGKNVTCFVCHNPHSTTDDGYGTLLSTGGFNNTSYADVKEAKLSFFNATASNASRFVNGTNVFLGNNTTLVDGNDIFDLLSVPASLYGGSSVKINGTTMKDSNYDPDPINVSINISEVLCAKCHYRHGIEHIRKVNMTHGKNNASVDEWATCIDCHMSKAGGKTDHSFDANEATNYPQYTCSKGSNCHVTSDENQSKSNGSIVPYENEWKASLHNQLEVGDFYINDTNFDETGHNNSSCSKCHSPKNWNPANESDIVTASDFTGVTCSICHNVHDMGDSINNSGLKYSWFKRNGIYSSSRWSSIYSLVTNSTELCGNCHSNVRIGREGPGWNGSGDNPTKPHGWPAKDVFVGSMKESGMMKFECIDCHMYVNKTNSTGYQLDDANKSVGHSFNVSAAGLQNTSACSSCHVNGTSVDTIENVISQIQSDTQTKWNSTNTTVQTALATVKAYTGVNTTSRDKISQAYWKLYLVSEDGSWGVHDPVGTDTLLNDAATLADDAVSSLGLATSNVDIASGWNLVSLNGTPLVTAPVSVLASVLDNVTVAWGYNATSQGWELYDPAMPTGLNTLTSIVPGKGYWIYATQSCKWTI